MSLSQIRIRQQTIMRLPMTAMQPDKPLHEAEIIINVTPEVQQQFEQNVEKLPDYHGFEYLETIVELLDENGQVIPNRERIKARG